VAKRPQSVDVEVGRRVRERRLRSRMSQSELAQSIGVTFQQVQKYEKGTNRIGAGRLSQIAKALDVPIASFFSPASPDEALPSISSPQDTDEISAVMATRDGVELVRAFAAVQDAATRRQIVALVQAISASHTNGGRSLRG